MSTPEDAPLLTASRRRRGGAALAAVVLALAGGLAFAVANRSDTTTSLNVSETIRQNFDVNEDAYAQALAALPASTSQDATNSKGESIILPLSPEKTKNSMMELNSGLHGKVGSIEKWCGAASRRTIVASAARRRGDAPPAQASHRHRSSGRRVPPLLRVLYHSRRDLWHPMR